MSALDDWRDGLDAWAIPQPILDAAPENPWGFPKELFGRRGRARTAGDAATTSSPTTQAAAAALPTGGTVLDVGVGGGATSLPLASRAGTIFGVDGQEEMLEEFLANARVAGVAAGATAGRWPDVADAVPSADVALSGHVLYNVADLAPFARALDAHALRRVVLELPDRHPLTWMNDLWLRFHDLRRPDRPTAQDAVEALRVCGFDPVRVDHPRDEDLTGSGFARREDAVALVRRRLCLPATRDEEIAEALGDRLAEHDGLWTTSAPGQTVVTLWWDTGGAERAGRVNRTGADG